MKPLSGFGGDVMTFGPPGCDAKFEADPGCFRRVKRAGMQVRFRLLPVPEQPAEYEMKT